MAAVVDQLTDSHCEPEKSSLGASTGVPTQGAVVAPTGGRSPVVRKPGSSPPAGGGASFVVMVVGQVPPAGPHWTATVEARAWVTVLTLSGVLRLGARVDDVEGAARTAEHHPVLRALAAGDGLDRDGGRLVADALDAAAGGQPVARHGAGAERAGGDGVRLRRVLRGGVGVGDVGGDRRGGAGRGERAGDRLLRRRRSLERVAAEAGGAGTVRDRARARSRRR